MIPPPVGQGGALRRSEGYVYLLRSVRNGRYYVGWTTDLQRRLAEHQDGKSSYTRSRGPWTLVGYERYATQDEAKRRERTLKRYPRMLSQFKKRATVNMLRTACGSPRQVVG